MYKSYFTILLHHDRILFVNIHFINEVSIMSKKNETLFRIVSGLVIGVIAALLVLFGNPKNMGLCIACFVRDTAGGIGLHRAAPVQYIRPEIIGIIFAAFFAAIFGKEYKPHGGSSPITRFVLGMFVVIGALVFLGCPMRMWLRLAGGDLNAILGIVGYFAGISAGVFFLRKGYTLGEPKKQGHLEGAIFPLLQIVLLILLIAAPAFIFFTEAGEGPGGSHAAILVSLAAGLIVGALGQRMHLCMVGGFRNPIFYRDMTLGWGPIMIFVGALVTNLILTLVTGKPFFSPSFADQPVAHTDGVWNFLGMFLVGFASNMLSGCPLRQLIMSGEGNTDAAITVTGFIVGAAFAHNFGLASSGNGPTVNGQIAVIIGIAFTALIAAWNTFRKSDNA